MSAEQRLDVDPKPNSYEVGRTGACIVERTATGTVFREPVTPRWSAAMRDRLKGMAIGTVVLVGVLLLVQYGPTAALAVGGFVALGVLARHLDFGRWPVGVVTYPAAVLVLLIASFAGQVPFVVAAIVVHLALSISPNLELWVQSKITRVRQMEIRTETEGASAGGYRSAPTAQIIINGVSRDLGSVMMVRCVKWTDETSGSSNMFTAGRVSHSRDVYVLMALRDGADISLYEVARYYSRTDFQLADKPAIALRNELAAKCGLEPSKTLKDPGLGAGSPISFRVHVGSFLTTLLLLSGFYLFINAIHPLAYDWRIGAPLGLVIVILAVWRDVKATRATSRWNAALVDTLSQ